MVEILSLIDELIEEHKSILQRVQTAVQVANDASAILELDRAKDDFVPGRFSDQQQSLQDLQESLEIIEKGLQAHFEREETALLTAFENHGGQTLVSALHSLLLEHENLRNRFAHAQKHVAELTSGNLSRHAWEASAHDMRAHLNHTLKLIEAHAHSEKQLFHKLSAELREA